MLYFNPDELAIIKLYLGSYATPRKYVQQQMRDILPYIEDPMMLKSLEKILQKLDQINDTDFWQLDFSDVPEL